MFSGPRKHSNKPQDRVVTYSQILVDYREHKKYPNRVKLTARGGGLIQYPGEFTTRIADM